MSGGRQARPGRAGRRWPPAALRTRAFWLTVALPAPFVFGSMSMAIVVLPEEVTSASTLSAAFAGLMTALAFAAGIGVQPAARRFSRSAATALGILAGTGAAAAGAAVSAVAVAGPTGCSPGSARCSSVSPTGSASSAACTRPSSSAAPTDRGAVLACYYVLAYLGFARRTRWTG